MNITMKTQCLVLVVILLILVPLIAVSQSANVPKPLRISLTVSSKLRRIEISWYDIQPSSGIILLTDRDPIHDEFVHESQSAADQSSAANNDHQYYAHSNASTIQNLTIIDNSPKNWYFGLDKRPVLYSLPITAPNGWHTTTIQFDDKLLKNISTTTKCYGYWTRYLDAGGRIMADGCISAYATWMTDMKEHIGQFKFRDLFLVGTHDSGSYRENFDALQNETLVTKYSITQDFDIRTQLLHGIRYLDIRVGYYRATDPTFWVNHGISRQQPLRKILEQVRDFVLETNELVIFDIQEFPVGFGKNLAIHQKLVQYVQNEIGPYMVDPSLTWQTKLDDIWKLKKNIIVSYDYISVVEEFPTLLWHSVQQRWGNVQSLADLKRYLAPSGRNFILFSSRPIADMAELTPNTWDVITDRYGGLRRMADQANPEISRWYYDEWGPTANVVAVDFVHGTSLMETAMYWNSRKGNLK